jgi:hypothetical protein
MMGSKEDIAHSWERERCGCNEHNGLTPPHIAQPSELIDQLIATCTHMKGS